METVEYCGPHDAVIVPEIDPDRAIRRGEALEVAAELAERLLAQAGNWRKPAPARAARQNP